MALGSHHRGGKKPGSDSTGNAERATAAAVLHYLAGLEFPASRQEIMDTARANRAPENVVHVVQQFSDRMYNYPTDIAREVELIE